MAGIYEAVRDKIIFEILKFFARRISLTVTGTATIAGAVGWLSAVTWEIGALWTIASTLIVMVVLIQFRDSVLGKDLFLKPGQYRTLVRRLKPYSEYEIEVTYFVIEGQQYALDIAAAFSAAGCKSVKQQAGRMPINPGLRFEVCGPDETAGRAVSAIFGSIGLTAPYRKTISSNPRSIAVHIIRPI